MTKISVSSYICNSNHVITGSVEGDRIIIKIDTPCEEFRKSGFLELPLYGLPEDQNNLILEMEGQIGWSLNCTKECALDCTRQCLIPPAVFSVCNIESGIAKKELAESALSETSLLENTEYTTRKSSNFVLNRQ